MHVLTLTSLFPNSLQPNKGVFIRSRMENFSRKFGHDWTVVAPVPWFPRLPFKVSPAYDTFARIPAEEKPWGYPIHHPRYLVTPKIGMGGYGDWMARGVRALVRRIHRERPIDVIDGHFIYPDGTAAVAMGRELGIPVILSARGSDLSLYSGLPRIVPRLRANLAGCDHVICVCTELKRTALSLGAAATRISVVGNGVDTQLFQRMDRARARAELGIPADATLFLSVGNLTELKGFHLILEALAGLPASAEGASAHGAASESGPPRIAIVGAGPQRAELERIAARPELQGRVLLPGSVLQRDLPRWYSAADHFVLASSREGWPNVVTEAQAMGLPVVCTRVWGVSEIVTDDSLGVLIGERTPEALRSAMAKALATPWDRAHIEASGRARTWDRVSEELQGLFTGVVSGYAGRSERT